ncbi:methyltransferase [Pseudenhygromyxa sp. WMMC2535]|uniref:methyltransferase n=1 Tax=Pseudenhygromyxa sp. WMMC2535 TaxID=2712867 RepID=UPI001595AEC0|nr:methyltransferase [Pseudenhygromyxa sp. WMMC2535]NVB37865.1 methyltransferase [Pseudenhygromyxa sp. WMMC2535]
MTRRRAATGSDEEPRPGGLEGLNPDDPGVRLLARAVAQEEPEGLLLVHCGELPGLRPGATRLILDVRERTGSAHRCVPDVDPLPDELSTASFSAALVWPRAHLGKDFSAACLARGALSLRPGGRLYCAARKQKGGKSLGRTMKALLGEDAVQVEARERGYHLWVGERGPGFDEALARELVGRRYELEDPILRELTLASRPGVFSRRELDAGTRALLGVAEAVAAQWEGLGLKPLRVLDLCAGVGPLALWSAQRWPQARVLAVESNLRACAMLRENAARNGLDERVSVLEHDAMPAVDTLEGALRGFAGSVDLALLNPPTHADPETLRRLFDLRAWLAPNAPMLLVVNRPGRSAELLQELGASVDGGERDGYFILRAVFGR